MHMTDTQIGKLELRGRGWERGFLKKFCRVWRSSFFSSVFLSLFFSFLMLVSSFEIIAFLVGVFGSGCFFF